MLKLRENFIFDFLFLAWLKAEVIVKNATLPIDQQSPRQNRYLVVLQQGAVVVYGNHVGDRGLVALEETLHFFQRVAGRMYADNRQFVAVILMHHTDEGNFFDAGGAGDRPEHQQRRFVGENPRKLELLTGNIRQLDAVER